MVGLFGVQKAAALSMPWLSLSTQHLAVFLMFRPGRCFSLRRPYRFQWKVLIVLPVAIVAVYLSPRINPFIQTFAWDERLGEYC